MEKEELVAYIQSGCKTKDQFRIGTEHEKFGYCLTSYKPLPFFGEKSISTIFKHLIETHAYQPVIENNNIIALTKNNLSISLEPAGQLELSGAPVKNLHQTCSEVRSHLEEIKDISKNLQVGFLGMGFCPFWTRDEMPRIPKDRYKIMRNYMPKVGNLGLDMMHRTCTVQVNLDFENQNDMQKKMRIGFALQSIVTAIFSNSAIKEGVNTNFQSYRGHIWTDTDPSRTGFINKIFEENFTFADYVEYALDVPMYFIHRQGKYYDVTGRSFRKYLQHGFSDLPNIQASMKDFEDHISTIFTEVRMKKFIEMRGADSGPWSRICSLPALWVGLLYDDQSMKDIHNYTKNWTFQDIKDLRIICIKDGLKGVHKQTKINDLAIDVLNISLQGLKRRQIKSGNVNDETQYLLPLIENCKSGKTFSDIAIELCQHNVTSSSQNYKQLYKEFCINS